ncbi:ribosome biogenesis GTPase Der [Aliikangiella coralliicola]|uniref:GTPase Der n=1 Tax=Aliikangiella coralliicola TaxID=2592383 RepID=A0A545UBP5_9GAMM|nr:ribosome biogenesis GTPase Der [Aliikangiella coralliicola]TQV86892.1 ribosome biogenesis GTPase Der [Aliikangiella coralliicola]
MLPVIALVGRPNVGKSTLFNRFTRTRDALVADLPGLTRDRQYGHAKLQNNPFIIIDTGGITGGEVGVDGLMAEQSMQAVREADIVLFIVSARDGLTTIDESIAQQLRLENKTINLVVNKVDGFDQNTVLTDFYSLGFESVSAIAAAHGRGVGRLVEDVILPAANLSAIEPEPTPEFSEEQLIASAEDSADSESEESTKTDEIELGPKLAIIGRPNVGKSTLVNRMLGEDRVVVYDMPGTTRDSIYIEMERRDKKYTLIDTAGVRKRGRVHEAVEKFSVLKTLQAINDANVVIMIFDAREGITEQDLNLLGFAIDAGRSLVLGINKWDNLPEDKRTDVKEAITRRLHFADFARVKFISALHGTNVGHLWEAVDEAYAGARVKMNASKLTRILEMAVAKHQPPAGGRFKIKLRFAHPGGHNPPRIVIHGNQTKSLPNSYIRYLEKSFREALKIIGTPIKFELKESQNPYEGRKKKVTEELLEKSRRNRKKIKKLSKKK